MNKSTFWESKGFDVQYSICKSIVKFTAQNMGILGLAHVSQDKWKDIPDCQKNVQYLQD